jgi:GT2 family glycosyltransferase
MMRPVLVGMVTYHSREDLPALVQSLAVQMYPAVRVIALDNASGDGSAEWLETNTPHITVIRSPENIGFGRGHNRILQERRPDEAYLALNPDVVLDPDAIGALVAATADGTHQWATGKLLLPGREHLYSVGHALDRSGYAFNIGHGLRDTGQFDQPREVFGAPGAMVLYMPELLARLAPTGDLFDPAMFLYGEDTDVDWRARRAGLRCIYTPDAIAVHRGSHAAPHLRAEALANRYLSVIKNAYWRDLLLFNLPFIVIHLMLRLVLTPRRGAQIAAKVLRYAVPMLRKRESPTLTRAQILAWFAWSRAQITGQPRTLWQRLNAFRATSARVRHSSPQVPPR